MTAKRALITALVALAALPAAAFAHATELQPVLSGPPAASVPVNPIRPAGCPSTVDPASFTSTNELYNLDAAMARFGPRPTGSPAHERFIDWLQRWMDTLPGMRLGYPSDGGRS